MACRSIPSLICLFSALATEFGPAFFTPASFKSFTSAEVKFFIKVSKAFGSSDFKPNSFIFFIIFCWGKINLR